MRILRSDCANDSQPIYANEHIFIFLLVLLRLPLDEKSGSVCVRECKPDQNASFQSTPPVSILHESIAGRYRPVRVADGPITARCTFV